MKWQLEFEEEGEDNFFSFLFFEKSFSPFLCFSSCGAFVPSSIQLQKAKSETV